MTTYLQDFHLCIDDYAGRGILGQQQSIRLLLDIHPFRHLFSHPRTSFFRSVDR
jgi:hypothetical protein